MATEAKAKEVQGLKDGKLDEDLKDASAMREKLSKDLVQATSEMTNKKTALEDEVKALEAVKKASLFSSFSLSLSLYLFLFTSLETGSIFWILRCGGCIHAHRLVSPWDC